MQNHIVAKAGELIVMTTAFRLDSDMAYLREMPLQGNKESRIDDQLLLLSYALLYPPLQMDARQRGAGLIVLHRGMVRLQQRQAADISHKDTARRPPRVHCALQDTQEIVNTGKVLHHRVENDCIKGFGFDAFKILRLLVDEGHMLQPIYGPLHLLEMSQRL